MMNEEAAELAEQAAGLIMEYGHGKGNFVDDDGSLCVMGALNMAHGGKTQSADIDETYLTVYAALMNRFGTPPARWNDRTDTTGEDIILALKRVAEDLRS